MKTFLFGTGFFLLFAFSAKSQIIDPLNVVEYKLDNGLTVYLNEDHTQPIVTGAVAIKGGSLRDPKDATGIAHYLEHMMFKGTDKMGTIDYDQEKIYLDSITLKYDELGKTVDEDQRLEIQKTINRLSLKAGEYAIPNEFDRIVADMGGTNTNAFTSEDNIVYFNMFPPNQMEKWLDLYSHRFIHPVFRLFQSELETVYEEKNMSMDDYGSMLFENFGKHFFKKSPYGQQTVLGNTEHLKNPSLSKMYEYFNTFYVANNMALMLSGDFNTEEVIPLIQKYFSVLKTGTIPALPDYTEEPFQGREFVKVRLTPIPIGILGYRGVKTGDADNIVLSVISQLLSNEASTGFFDKLYMDNKIMAAGIFANSFVYDGSIMVFFVPKLFSQSLKNAEKLIYAEIEKIKNGDFSDEMLNAVKVNMKKDHESSLENMKYRPFSILDCFNTGKSWSEIRNYPADVDKITKDDVMKAAKKYFGENRLVMYSKMGIPKKEKLKKPPFEPVIPKNSEAKSSYAEELSKIDVRPIEPKFIEFQNDVKFTDLAENLHYYYTKNTMNDIFTLRVQFGIGTQEIPMLKYAANYMNLLGSENKSFNELKKSLQALGATASVYTSRSYLTLTVEGMDQNFEKTIVLVNEWLTKPRADEKQLEKFPREEKSERKTEIKDPSTKGSALRDYALYKGNSSFLRRLSLNEVKNLNSDTLLNTFKKAMNYEADIMYCGKIDDTEVGKIITQNFSFSPNLIKSKSPVILDRENYPENTVFLLDDKNMIQSQIYLIKEGEPISDDSRSISQAFNEYFGGGMNSIVFQEIREFRSLAYTASAWYIAPFYNDKPGYLSGYMSTQSDKTIDALSAFKQLTDTIPQKPERMETVRSSLLQSINSEWPGFRNLSSSVSSWIRQGYNEDPRKQRLESWKNMTFEDLIKFYDQNFSNKSTLYIIAGDKSRIDMEKLSKFGKIVEVTADDIFSK